MSTRASRFAAEFWIDRLKATWQGKPMSQASISAVEATEPNPGRSRPIER
jgi:hypothetical protein